jgi:hypothetical protein
MTPVRVLVIPHEKAVAPELHGWLLLVDLPWASVWAFASGYCGYVLTVGGNTGPCPTPMPPDVFELKFDTPDQAREWILQDSVRRGPSVGRVQ